MNQKIEYMRHAANLCNFGFSYDQLDLLVSLYDLVSEKGGDTDLKMICQTEYEAKERAEERSQQILVERIKKEKQ